MSGRKRVLLTVSPPLIAGRRCMTPRALATALDPHVDLVVIPAGAYDFGKRRVRGYRRTRGGRFEPIGDIAPAADLWIVYSDGYYLDHRALGFTRRRDFFDAQLAFHQQSLDSGAVGRIVNPPAVEARTLKSWLATLQPDDYGVIPTHVFASIDEVHDLVQRERAIVAKPDWGGAAHGVARLSCEKDIADFTGRLAEAGETLADYCFQPYRTGDEKRFWFAGGRFVAARTMHGRSTPWSATADDYDVRRYDTAVAGFAADLAAAQRLCERAALEIGSIDFIGERINEINGGGTIFTEYRGWSCVVDARPALVRFALGLVRAL